MVGAVRGVRPYAPAELGVDRHHHLPTRLGAAHPVGEPGQRPVQLAQQDGLQLLLVRVRVEATERHRERPAWTLPPRRTARPGPAARPAGCVPRPSPWRVPARRPGPPCPGRRRRVPGGSSRPPTAGRRSRRRPGSRPPTHRPGRRRARPASPRTGPWRPSVRSPARRRRHSAPRPAAAAAPARRRPPAGGRRRRSPANGPATRCCPAGPAARCARCPSTGSGCGPASGSRPRARSPARRRTSAGAGRPAPG